MGITGNAALTVTKQDLVAALVQKELISEAVLAGTIMDVSRFAVKGAQSISFPRAGSFTVENRASGAAATTQNLTFAKDKLDLDYRATVSWLIDSMDELESVIDVNAEYAVRAARAHALYLDQQIIVKMEAAGVATATTGDVTDAVLLEMRTSLLKRKANRRALRFAVSPDQEAKILAISKFVSMQEYGSAVVPSGALGTIYGVPIYITPELATQQYFMYDAEGMALGFQRGPQMDERNAPEYGTGSMLKVLDQKFGLKALQIAEQGVGAGLSALIEKDNN